MNMSRGKTWNLEDANLFSGGTDFDKNGPMSAEHAEDLYERTRHLMNDEHREYLAAIERGEGKIDGVTELEILMRQASLYASTIIEWSLTEQKYTRDVPPAIGEVRQIATAIENAKYKRGEQARKDGDDGHIFDPTSNTPKSRFEDIHGGNT
jgi:hypothetical protein